MMAFPETVLPITVELNLDGTWTDITSDVYERDEIRITRGRSDWGQVVDPGRCQFTLNNETGKYSPRNPRGQYYGQIGRNTPVRVSVDAGNPYLDVPGGTLDRATTPDHASLDIIGDIDIRVDARLDNWGQEAFLEIAAKQELIGDQRSWRLVHLGDTGRAEFVWFTNGTAASGISAQSTVPLPTWPGQRLALRVTLDVNNGSGGHTVTFYTADTIAGPWAQLGAPVTGAGTTSIYNSTSPLDVGNVQGMALGVPVGRYYAMQLRNGIGGTIVADVDFTARTVGDTSFADSAGRTWSVMGDAQITNRQTRFHGEISEWPVRWGTGGHDVYVQVEASGILRRLGQGAAPLQSTLRRRIPTDPSLLAYWPMEEGENATQASSPVAGVRPMTVIGLDFAASDTLAGSSPLPTLDSQSNAIVPRIHGLVPTSSATEWRTEFLYNLDAPPTTERTFMRALSSGTVREWYMKMSSTGGTLLGNDADGIAVVTDNFAWGGIVPFGSWYRLALNCVQDGVNVDYALTWTEIDVSGIAISGTYAGSVGRVTAMSAPPGGYSSDLDGMALGHIAVFSDADTTIFNSADHGYNQETAGARLTRLSGEESVPLTVYSATGDQEEMGPQTPETLLTLFREAAEADGGILYEARDSTAVAYRDRSTLYNQPVTLTLDYTGDDGLVTPLDPTDDDQAVRNDITVTRVKGSSARVTATEGPLSTLAPPNGIGRYDQAVTLNLYEDEQTENQASWRVHLGTWDESRYPTVRVLLQNAVHLIDDAAAVDIGSRMQVTNPPDWLPADTIDVLVQGYTELLHQKRWELDFTTSPAGPWTVPVLDDDDARLDTAGAELTSGVTSTATSLSVTTTSGPVWITSAASASDFPFDIRVGGEVMTVTAISSTTSPQTFTVTRSVNGVVKAHSAGAAVGLAHPAYLAL